MKTILKDKFNQLINELMMKYRHTCLLGLGSLRTNVPRFSSAAVGLTSRSVTGEGAATAAAAAVAAEGGAGDATDAAAARGVLTPASFSCRSVKRWRTTRASGRTASDSKSPQTDVVDVVPLLLRTASKASTFVFTEEALNGLQNSDISWIQIYSTMSKRSFNESINLYNKINIK